MKICNFTKRRQNLNEGDKKSPVSSVKSLTAAAGKGGGCGQARVHRVTDEDALAQDEGEADYLNTRGHDTQLETIGNWVRRTGGTRGREHDQKREEG